MDKNSEAVSFFEKACRFYQDGQFADAARLIRDYRRTVCYDKMVLSDRRKKEQVQISLIIVSFKGEKGLLECLDSLNRQKDPDFEIILVDNGGNESVYPKFVDYSLLHVRPPVNLMPSEGRNLGAHFSRGKYLAFIDDDAVVEQGFVNALKNAWHMFDFAAIRGRVLPKSSSANTSVSGGHYDMGVYPIPSVLMTEGNMAIVKDIFLEIGGFDPLVFGGEGTELTHRCLKKFPEKDIYYWPNMIIFHDFARGADFAAKKQRHALAADYFNYLASDINTLQMRYGRWYQSRPGGMIQYDQRSLLLKAFAFLSEKLNLSVYGSKTKNRKPRSR